MRYSAQYRYVCPRTPCRGAVVQPYVLPAAAAIDWSLPAQRIGARKKPLAPKTRLRIAAGLRRYRRPVTAGVAGRTTAGPGLACPPLLTPTGGTWNDDALPVTEPMRTRTTRENEAVVVSPSLSVPRPDRARTTSLDHPLATVAADGFLDALVVPLRNNGVAHAAAGHPLATFAAAGEHQALVMRNNTARGDAGQMCTPMDEPIRALTTAGHQSLIRWDHMLYQYDTGELRPLGEPMPTQTTVDGDAVLGIDIEVDDCTLRMLAVHEIQTGMAFDPAFTLLGKAKRDKVRMLGNAVTPPAARDLAACLFEAVCGIDVDPAEFHPSPGNAMPANVAPWLGHRIAAALDSGSRQ
jgi:DNA (cytosine-5)-methyltransferase 1